MVRNHLHQPKRQALSLGKPRDYDTRNAAIVLSFK
jgi:hypothetical protein